MRSKSWVLLLEFVALTVPLTWLWIVWGRDAYHAFFTVAAAPFLSLLGTPPLQLAESPQRFINYVPFLVLMLITPGLSARRRTLGSLLGIFLIFLCHVGMVWVAFKAYSEARSTAKAFPMVFPSLLISDALPFVLWAIIAHEFVRDMMTRAMAKVAPQSPPES